MTYGVGVPLLEPAFQTQVQTHFPPSHVHDPDQDPPPLLEPPPETIYSCSSVSSGGSGIGGRVAPVVS